MAKFANDPHHDHSHYHWIPVVCSTTWCITLLVLILTWVGQGRPHYVSQGTSFPYISDIAADILKPLFVIGCIITALAFIGTLVAERWLRHRGRLTHESTTAQKVLAGLAIFGSVLGGAGLILLSGFDTKRYTVPHRIFLGMFMLGVALSAIFTVVEYLSLSKHNRDNRALMWSALSKALVASILIGLAIAMGICLSQGLELGAIFEWTISFGFVFYPLTFWIDLYRAEPQWKVEETGMQGPRMEEAR